MKSGRENGMATGADETTMAKVATSAPAPKAERVARLLAAEPGLAGTVPLPAVTAELGRADLKSAQIVATLFERYADRAAFGQRVTEVVRNAAGRQVVRQVAQFETFTFWQVQARVQALLNFWAGEDAHATRPGDIACLIGFASVDFTVVDLACICAGLVSVPLQTNFGIDGLAAIIAETEAAVVAVQFDHLDKALALIAAGAVIPSLIVLDYDPRDDDQRDTFAAAQAKLAGSGTAVIALSEALALGEQLPQARFYIPPADQNPLATMYYTSGTTGKPKGVMLHDHLYRRLFGAPQVNAGVPIVSLCYLPQNHGFGRGTVMRAFCCGGVCYFAAKSDMTSFYEDAQLARPTSLDLVPRVSEMIYNHFRGEVARRLANRPGDEAAIRADVMEEMRRSLLGGRLIWINTATAPTAPEIRQFLIDCFQVDVTDFYGGTETGVLTDNGKIRRPPIIDYKLVDVPELGYYTTDRPYPRGQLLVKTASICGGYYKAPELTAKMFDADGYFAVDDVVEDRGNDHIVYIDRRNNVTKLSQGEFVAIAQLETTLVSGDPLIQQAYLYGDSTRSYLLAVLVPNLAIAQERLGHEPEPAELRTLLRDAVQKVAQGAGLHAYEVPRDFLVETQPFSAAEGLLTEVGKIMRAKLKAKYGPALEELYAKLSEQQQQDLRALHDGGAGLSTLERVSGALKATLGIAEIDLSLMQGFSELGGDSLAAIDFANLLEEIFDVVVPVSLILHPSGSLAEIAGYIDRIRENTGQQTSFAAIHGDDPHEVKAADLTLAKFFPGAALGCLRSARAEVRTVLLTGSTGFLGRFLCIEWMKRVAPLGGKVICIVRATDAAEARARMDNAIDKGDPALVRRFHELAADHLELLVGDLSAPNLGLDSAVHARLADEVDLVFHNAALVNHRLGYRQLFEPNVLGTVELIRLALTRRRKRFDYVSTMGVAHRGEGGSIGEEADVREASPTRAIDDGVYANGYSISKWAGEVLLRDAHEKYGLPVNVYRSDMILPHSTYAGQINATDTFARLLFSVIRTGLAPASFYAPGPDGARARAHYNGLPVDFLARTLVGIAAEGGEDFTTYNVDNPNDAAGISLDSFVDWIAAAGYPVRRVADYGEWVAEFERRLGQLPEADRRRSSLQILGQIREVIPARRTPVDCAQFRASVRRLKTDPSGDIPPLTQAYVAKCIDDLVTLGMVPAAEVLTT